VYDSRDGTLRRTLSFPHPGNIRACRAPWNPKAIYCSLESEGTMVAIQSDTGSVQQMFKCAMKGNGSFSLWLI
jgi:hypothetical protein